MDYFLCVIRGQSLALEIDLVQKVDMSISYDYNELYTF